MIDVSTLTTEELTTLASGIRDELMARQERRKLELIDDFIKAFQTLVKECPGVRLAIERQCHDCGCWDGIDVMSYFGTTLQPSNFDL